MNCNITTKIFDYRKLSIGNKKKLFFYRLVNQSYFDLEKRDTQPLTKLHHGIKVTHNGENGLGMV